MYTVIAQRQIPQPLERVWQFLTEPQWLARWFADTESFAPGAPFQFDFGDGDFFAGSVTEWDPQIVLGLRWKFVGLGPDYDVRFTLLRRKNGVELSIQDRGAITMEEAECLRVGWSEFLMRLEKSVQQNRSARFNWRKALTFTACIGERREELAASLQDPRWYRDNLGEVEAKLHASAEHEIVVALSNPKWGKIETTARLNFKQIRGVDYLFIAHEGWPELPSKIAAGERRRFVKIWIDALRQFDAT